MFLGQLANPLITRLGRTITWENLYVIPKRFSSIGNLLIILRQFIYYFLLYNHITNKNIWWSFFFTPTITFTSFNRTKYFKMFFKQFRLTHSVVKTNIYRLFRKPLWLTYPSSIIILKFYNWTLLTLFCYRITRSSPKILLRARMSTIVYRNYYENYKWKAYYFWQIINCQNLISTTYLL